MSIFIKTINYQNVGRKKYVKTIKQPVTKIEKIAHSDGIISLYIVKKSIINRGKLGLKVRNVG
ncbi:hypothetical protein MSIBF_A1740004 [groundwater metagenome]|uniref:Uncharacterized protein n=1 Tax=groundwater metagenome TaxID=717931 RepID=A0A098E783_9ZZZZ